MVVQRVGLLLFCLGVFGVVAVGGVAGETGHSEVGATDGPTTDDPDASFIVDIEEINEPVAGADLAVTYTVTNEGPPPATGTQTIELTVGDLGTNSTAVTLDGGNSTQGTLTVDTGEGDAGTYTATVASENDTVSESATVLEPATFTVDIVVTGDPVEGEALTVISTVTNTGDVAGTATVTLDVGSLGTNATNVTLSDGDSTSETLTVGTGAGDAGTYTATVTSPDDSDSASVTVLEQAAFAVGVVETNDSAEGEPVTVTATVENTGDVEGTQQVTLDVGSLGTNATDVTLAGGAATELTLTVATVEGDAGEYTATVTSANDTASANVTVLEAGAFLVEIVDAGDPVEGDPVAVTATVENTGDTQATQTVTLSVGSLGTNATNVTLAGGAATEVELAVETGADDAGAYTATVASENDSASANVTVLAPAAFAVEVVGASDAVAGEQVDVTVAVTNTGDLAGTDTVTLSVGSLGGNATNVTLGGGASTEVGLAVDTVEGDTGTYTATVASGDDTDSTPVTVLAPAAFAVEIVGVSAPVEGADLAVTAAVENTGDIADTQTVSLAVGGLGGNSTMLSLAGNESTGVTLSVATGAGDAGEYTATVTSEDDSDSATATVLAPAEFAVEVIGVTDPVAGEDIAVTALVENTGDVEATQSVTLAVEGVGENATTVTLDGGTSVVETLTVGTTAGDAGEYTATVTSANDTATANVTVLAPAAFTVELLDASESVEGDSVDILVGVENVGDVADTQDLTLAVGGLGASTTSVTLAGGASTEQTLSVATELGDAGEYTAEVASADDSASTPVTVLAQSAFTVDIVTASDPVAGEALDVTVALENAGSAGDTQTVSLDAGGLGENSTNVTLAGGASVEETLSVPTGEGDAGEYTATVTAGNDSDSANVTVLTPTAFTVDIVGVSDPVGGEPLAVTAAIENVGDAAGTGTVALTAGALGGNSTNVTLAGNESTEETLSVPTGAGDAGEYTATVTVGNDTASETVAVLAPAAFAVAAVATADPVEGEQLAVTATVENTGDVEGTETLTLDVGALGQDSTTVTLAGNGSTAETLTVPTGAGDAGEYTAAVTAGNDTASTPVTVLAPAAFAVDIVDTSDPVAGEALAVTVAVENVGDVEATQSVELAVGDLGENSTNVTLGGGASVEETLSVPTGEGDAGEYTATVTSGNDSASANVTVLAPAAFAVEILNATGAVEGEAVEVLAAVENVGDIEGTGPVTLDVGALGEENRTVTLAGGESTDETLSVPTGEGDAGEYTATVTSADDSDSANVTVLTPASFTVAVVGVNDPVEGEDLAVTVAVENVGGVTATRAVALEVAGLGTDSTNVTLAGGASVEETLSVGTSTGDAGPYTATVTTADDSASANVTVLEPATFELAGVETNAPVIEGADLAVTVTVTNTGDVSAVRTVSVGTAPLGTNTTELEVSSGETIETTLVVPTAVGQAGTYTLTVTAGDATAAAAVELQLPALPGQDGPPTDPLGDGELYEDVDGDEVFDIFDVQTLFNQFGSPAVQDHAWAYDFNGDSVVSIFDVQALFNRL